MLDAARPVRPPRAAPDALTDDATADEMVAVEARMAELVAGHAPAAEALQGGGRLRARLCLRAGDASSEALVSAAAGCELLHAASLVHDDLQDGDDRRRGRPSVWAAHGAAAAICTGDLLISAAFAALAEADPRLVPAAHAAVSRTVSGQMADLSATPPRTVDAWEAVARAKCGPLLALPLQAALALGGRSDARDDADRAAEAFAVAYQALDDCADGAVDAPRPDRRGRPNVLTLLSRTEAADLAARHLSNARAAARRLPDGAARAFLAEVDRLSLCLEVLHAA